jgi:hypothetical protein
MKSINETFSDQEFSALKERKGERSWHDYIVYLSNRVALQDEAAKHIEVTQVKKKA